MNKPIEPNLTKTCMNCGQQKPLTAFLEMSDTHGTIYGNVCSSCRKTAMEAAERRKKSEAEGSSSTETEHKIDSKTKVHDAIDKREQFHRIEEDYHKERGLDEKLIDEKIEKKDFITRTEKKHRESFLGKRTVLPSDKKAASHHAASIKHNAEFNARSDQHIASTAQTTHNTQEEGKKTQLDFNVANQGQQVAGQVRFSGQAFQQFRQWLGNSAPIVSNVHQTITKVAPKKAGAIAQSGHETKNTEATPDKTSSDPAVEFIEKNWRPGGKR